jgi:hypothetical protein
MILRSALMVIITYAFVALRVWASTVAIDRLEAHRRAVVDRPKGQPQTGEARVSVNHHVFQ